MGKQSHRLSWVPAFVIALAVAGAGALHFAAKEERVLGEPEQPECRFQFDQFQKTVSYRNGGNRLRIVADQACGWKHGRIYDLENVRLTLGTGEKDLVSIHAGKGTFVFRKNQLLISGALATDSSSCLRRADQMIVDLDTGEVRTPGLRLFMNGARPIACSQFRGKGVI
jgi:hypothetical protein